MLALPDIETLGELRIDDKTIGRQLALGDNADKRQSKTSSVKEHFKQKVGSLRPMQTLGRMLMYKKQTTKPHANKYGITIDIHI